MKKSLNIGLAGLGTVGQSLIKILQNREGRLTLRTGTRLNLVAISARDKSKEREIDISAYTFMESPIHLAKSPDIDVFVELIGGADGIAYESVMTALKTGKSVVTANKALLSKHGLELAKCAEENNTSLYYEAAVAGGVPIIKTLRESLAGNSISKVYGILNGTCNFILTKMKEEKAPFEKVLCEAQEKGYAEADPTFDIEGYDTAHKLSILSALAFGGIMQQEMTCEGIKNITLEDIISADAQGFNIKLLGIAERHEDKVLQRVYPALLPKSAALAEVNGVLNAVMVEGDAVSELMLVGPGAGGMATASAVVGDLIDVAADVKPNTFGRQTKDLIQFKHLSITHRQGSYFLRFLLKDQSGSFARIATELAKENVSLHTVHQTESEFENTQQVTLITHDTREENLQNALSAINKSGVIEGSITMIRIERLHA